MLHVDELMLKKSEAAWFWELWKYGPKHIPNHDWIKLTEMMSLLYWIKKGTAIMRIFWKILFLKGTNPF